MTVAVSIYAIGGMIGALAAGIVADWIGRSGERERENGHVTDNLTIYSITFLPWCLYRQVPS